MPSASLASSSVSKLILALSIALCLASSAFAQLNERSAGGVPQVTGTTVGSLMIYLRTQDGQPLPETAVPLIRVHSTEDFSIFPNPPSRSGVGWVINDLPTGHEYEVQVTAAGFVPASETVDLPDVADATASVIIFMRPVDQQLVFHPPNGNFVLAPKAAKEIQRALADLQAGKTASAQKHTLKAMKMAEGNPYVQYVMGMTYVASQQYAKAKDYLEKSVSIDPGESASLDALGTVRYQLKDYGGAIEALSKAVRLDSKSWKSEWLLAAAYLEQKEYAEASDHADRALKIDRRKAGGVQLLLGQALAGLGNREGAAQAFDAFVADYPTDPNAQKAREWAKLMREPAKPLVTPVASLSVLSPLGSSGSVLVPKPPPAEIPPRPDWAPADVDAAKPFEISSATCSLPRILRRAGKNAEQLVDTLQQFSATEDFQGIELKRGEQLEKPSEHAFNYMVFIERVNPEVFDVREVRDSGAIETPWPGRIAGLGASALALAFHPAIQKDLDWKCEGLGTWDNQPAWVIHFQQKPEAPNVLARFTGTSGSYSLPLKGRAWVSERSAQVLHLDTDLVHEIKPIDLKREHFSIDYKPVFFSQHRARLWLPENVDTYIQYRGHFFHYYDRFSGFRLFWVGASQKINAPKEPNVEER